MERKMVSSYLLNVKMVNRLEAKVYDGVTYVRTKDVANVIGIKQPFEFNKQIRESLGIEAILKGDRTIKFRTAGLDTNRTTFISVDNLIKFFKVGTLRLRFEIKKLNELLEELNQ